MPEPSIALLRHLAAEVAALEQALGADDRQCHVVSHAGRRLGCKQVATRGLEEREHRLVFEGGGVREVDDDLRARKGLGQAPARDRVDARSG
jgi:hypothetical protein